MGKIKPRLSSRKKAKRWRKGQSSSSNPESKKYRELATAYFFQDHLDSTGLTTEKLKKHDALQGIPLTEQNEIDDQSTIDETSTLKTVDTFASDLSNCSNVSFNRFLQHFQSKSIIHKQMLAVLTAVAEVIKENDGTESSTEYYAALMSTLEAADSDISIAAILSLLHMVLKTLPKQVLKVQFGQASQIFLQILSKYAVTENFLILRHCIDCITSFLKVQESAVWSNSSTVQILNGILTFTTHDKPKVRKAAHHSIRVLINGSDTMKEENPPTPHPALYHVAKYSLEQLELNGQRSQITSALHILTLLKDICHQFPRNYVKLLCERLLGIMTLNDIKAKACCFQTLYSLFASRPCDTSLPPQLNGQIINALYDYQPSLEDEKLIPVWLIVMQEAHCNLATISLELSTENIPRFLEKCMEIFRSDRPIISKAVPKTVDTILQMCVAPLCAESKLSQTSRSTLCKIIHIIKHGMNYQYITVWGYVCGLLAVLFQVIGPVCQNELIEVLKELTELRESDNFTYKEQADYAIGAAVKTFGPEIVLETLQLKLGEDSIHVTRCDWLLPILDSCIKHATLAYFIKHLLPLAMLCESKAAKLKEKGENSESHVYELLTSRFWAVLPSFCNSSTDIKDSFHNIARTLGTALNTKKELRLCILSSLRKLILKSTENNNPEDIEQLTRFAKNYLPILFNIYTTKPNGSHEQAIRSSTFDTIKVYLTITSNDLISELFDSALVKLKNPEANDFMKESVFDLIRLLTQFTDIKRLTILYEFCKPLLQDTKKYKDQKKAYRFLEEICGSKNDVCKEFVIQNRCKIQTLLIESAKDVLNPSKSARIRTITHLVQNHPKLEKTKFLKAAIPEAVMCIKAQNEKCRTSSFDLLNVIANKFISNIENFETFISTLLTGLKGPPQYCSSTLLAFASIIYNYSGSLGVQTVLQILDQVQDLLKGSSREIVMSALAFIKAYLTVMPTPVVAPTLNNLVHTLSAMTDDCKRHFRQKVRDILIKMIRRYGFETVIAMVPTSDEIMHKRMKNIRKVEVRKQRMKEEMKGKLSGKDNVKEDEYTGKHKPKSIEDILADSDEEYSDTEDTSQTKTSKRAVRKEKAWIQENEDNIVDFIDPTSAKNITASRPENGKMNNKIPKSKRTDNGFKIAADGRLIIKEDSDVENNAEMNQKMKNLSFSENEEENEDVDDNETKSLKSTTSGVLSKRKRKLSGGSASVYSAASSNLIYKAGGTGIHRPVKVTTAEKNPGIEYSAKKAKGDIKKKGKPDPYAYLPLKRSALNKRKKMKNAGRFKNIINGVRKGVRSGKVRKRQGN